VIGLLGLGRLAVAYRAPGTPSEPRFTPCLHVVPQSLRVARVEVRTNARPRSRRLGPNLPCRGHAPRRGPGLPTVSLHDCPSYGYIGEPMRCVHRAVSQDASPRHKREIHGIQTRLLARSDGRRARSRRRCAERRERRRPLCHRQVALLVATRRHQGVVMPETRHGHGSSVGLGGKGLGVSGSSMRRALVPEPLHV